jgi:hypothetical protein
VFVELPALLIHKVGMLHGTNKIFFRLFFANLKSLILKGDWQHFFFGIRLEAA